MDSSHQKDSILSLKYCITLSIRLFSKCDCSLCFRCTKYAYGCNVPPSEETVCRTYFLSKGCIPQQDPVVYVQVVQKRRFKNLWQLRLFTSIF